MLPYSMLLHLLLFCLAPAGAQDPIADDDPGPVRGEEAGAFPNRLEAAKQLYFGGNHQSALALFNELQTELLHGLASPPWDVAAETMIFVAEVNLQLRRNDAARAAFRWVLERDVAYTVSPYHHPAHVRAEFFVVQNEVKAELQATQVGASPPPWEPRPLPAWGYLPLGVPQFSQRRTGAGIAHLTLQVALGAGSLAVMQHIRTINPGPGVVDHPRGWTGEEARSQVQRERYAVQWPLTVGFYGAWVASTLDARAYWRRSDRPRPNQVATQSLRRGAAPWLVVSSSF